MAGAGDIASLAMGANPYGGAVEMGAGLIKGITESAAAAAQAARADKLREQAKQVQTQTIRPEFLTAEHNAQMASMYGLPGLQAYRDQIGSNIANSIRAIKESSPNGEATLAAISSTLANGNKSTNDLSAQDAQSQERKGQYANDTIWNVGLQQRGLEDRRDKEKQQILAQAGALENASTANKQTGINDAVGGVEQGASQIFKMDDGSNTPMSQINTSNIPQSPYQLPSGAGASAGGLGQLPYMPYGPQGRSNKPTAQDYSSGAYVPIAPTSSNYNWSIYQ